MQNISLIPARNLQKFYKSIIDGVKTKKQPVLLTTNKKPQAAIVPLEDLEKLKVATATQTALGMLQLAAENKEELKGLPSDLRKKANEILYSNK